MVGANYFAGNEERFVAVLAVWRAVGDIAPPCFSDHQPARACRLASIRRSLLSAVNFWVTWFWFPPDWGAV